MHWHGLRRHPALAALREQSICRVRRLMQPGAEAEAAADGPASHHRAQRPAAGRGGARSDTACLQPRGSADVALQQPGTAAPSRGSAGHRPRCGGMPMGGGKKRESSREGAWGRCRPCRRPGFGSTRLAARRAAPGDAGTRRRSPSRSASLGSQLEQPRASPQPWEEKSPPVEKRRRPKPARDGFIHFPDVLMVSPLFAGR